LTALLAAPAIFSPNGDAVTETTLLTSLANYDDSSWTLDVKNAAGTTVRTFSGTAPEISSIWNGKDSAAGLVPDGPYTANLNASIGTVTASMSVGVIVDTAPPIAAITSPVSAEVLSNVYRDGSADVPVIGTASDANLNNWRVEYGSGATPSTWTILLDSTTNRTSEQLATWKSVDAANGTYTFRLQVWDKAGAQSSALVTAALGNFKVAQNAFQLAPTGTVTYTSTVPFPVTESLVIKNSAGVTVRTLVNGVSRNAGSFADPWNGKNDGGTTLPDGPYSYIATVTAGPSSMVWDLSTTYRATTTGGAYPTLAETFDPFNNVPLAVTYSLATASRVALQVGQSGLHYGPDCSAIAAQGTTCVTQWEYKPAGQNTYSWWGTDAGGQFLANKPGVNVIYRLDNFPSNVVLLYGTAPTITTVRVTPALFHPAASAPPVTAPTAGSHALTFVLGTYQSQPIGLTVQYVNQTSLSTLRTITASAQPAGTVSVNWDGRADNGMLVAPGYYTLIISATDSLGNVTKQHAITTVAY
jgi:flagellar hook assembly protein FlgD